MSGALVVFAKAPRPGLVKTRLCPPFTPEQAAAFYGCLLDDVLATTAAAARSLDLRLLLAVHPAEAVAELAARAPAGYEVFAQEGSSLAERMTRAVATVAAHGDAPILLRGSDSPTLAADVLAEAVSGLATAGVVIAPDLDGGYDLVALREPVPGLFDHAMSTASVLEDTLANARRAGLIPRVLAPGFDIDTASDLLRLAEARRDGRAGCCPRTLAWLDEHGMWPATRGE